MRSLLMAAIVAMSLFHGCSAVQTSTEPVSPQKLDGSAVPADLRDLLPLAEKWGIGDDVQRSEIERTSTREERQAFRTAVEPKSGSINEWLDSFGQGQMTDEAAAFLFMLEALEELPQE